MIKLIPINFFLLLAFSANASNHINQGLQNNQKELPIELRTKSSDFDSGRLNFRGLEIRQGEILIKSNHAETSRLDFANGEWVFSGNVEVKTETTKLFCNEARVRFKNHQLVNAEIKGTPARFEQILLNEGKSNNGEAIRMFYQIDTGILELYNDARFYDGTNEISGEKIIYDVVGKNLSVDSGKNGPVTILIEPID
ncbi:MAG: lipopolysaccharide transport periplasmic protein LptA [Pseudomonadota bacterium]|nr:lipopolysaccharide transport periplasmic protein LptA [Pseudomonadota bacterium]